MMGIKITQLYSDIELIQNEFDSLKKSIDDQEVTIKINWYEKKIMEIVDKLYQKSKAIDQLKRAML